MSNITVEVVLTPVQYKAMQYIAFDPHEWIQNAATSRAIAAIDEVSQQEIQRMLADSNTTVITADRNQLVLNSTRPNLKDASEMAA